MGAFLFLLVLLLLSQLHVELGKPFYIVKYIIIYLSIAEQGKFKLTSSRDISTVSPSKEIANINGSFLAIYSFTAFSSGYLRYVINSPDFRIKEADSESYI